jgi:hypothetical protein
MKLAPIQLNTFSGEDISKYYAFKKDFIAYIHAREDMPVEEKMVRLLFLTQGGPAYDLIVSVTRDEAGYHEALEQLDADFGNQDCQFACALGGLQDLTEVTLNDHATIRAARIAIRRVVSHLKQIPGTNVASHATTALMALHLSPEARFSLNQFQTSQNAVTLTFEMFEQWSSSQLLMSYQDPLSHRAAKVAKTTPVTKVNLPYMPKLPTKTLSVAGAYEDDEFGDGCSDLEETMMVMAISKDESGKYSLCIHCQKPHSLSKCPGFRAFNDAQRVALVKKTRTCWRCLQGQHRQSKCTRNWTCRDCGSVEHHTLLHGAFESKLINSANYKFGGSQPPLPQPPPSSGSGTPNGSAPNLSNGEILKILANLTAQMSKNAQGMNQATVAMPVADDILRTLSYLVAPVFLFHPLSPDKKFLVNSVFDTCAEGCFITERLATLLGLIGMNQPQILKLLSTTVTVQSRLVQFGVQSCTGEHRGQMIANTVREIQRSIKPPNLEELKKRFPYLNDIAFPAKAEGYQINLLIGLEFFEWMAPYLVRYEGRSKPCVLHTLLGPVVMFGEPRQKSLDTFSAPVSNMAVTILAASTDQEQDQNRELFSLPSMHSTIMATATSTEDADDEDIPHPPPLTELLSQLWRYDVMGIDTNLKRGDKQFSIEEQFAWDTLQDGITILPNLALQIPIPW